MIDLATIFSKLYKSIQVSKSNELAGISDKAKRKSELLSDFRQSINEVKKHKEGKLKLKTARELLNEL